MSMNTEAFCSQLSRFDDQVTPACAQRRPARNPRTMPAMTPARCTATPRVRVARCASVAERRAREKLAANQARRVLSREVVAREAPQEHPQRDRRDLSEENRGAKSRLERLPGRVEAYEGLPPVGPVGRGLIVGLHRRGIYERRRSLGQWIAGKLHDAVEEPGVEHGAAELLGHLHEDVTPLFVLGRRELVGVLRLLQPRERLRVDVADRLGQALARLGDRVSTTCLNFGGSAARRADDMMGRR